MLHEPTHLEMKQKIEDFKEALAAQKQIEEALRESKQIYKMISEKSFAGIYVVQDGNFRAVNPSAAFYAGYTIGELTGMKSDCIVHPDDRLQVKRDARAMLRGERVSPYEFRIITKDGQIRWIMETVTSIFFEGRPAILGNSMNITDRKQIEERLKESENLYRAIFETTPAATIIVEEDTTISLVNSQFEKLSGYRKEEWEGKKSWTEFAASKDVERMMNYHRRRRTSPGMVPRNYEFSLIDSLGRTREVTLIVDMIPGTKKSVASLLDITERKRSEEKMLESENLYRTIFETTGTATIIVEEDMTVSLVNTEFEKMSGSPKSYWEGKRSWTEFASKKDVTRMKKYHFARRVDPNLAPRNYEFGFIDRQKNLKDTIITISMIPGTKKSVASFVDITERKRAEKELKKREAELQINSANLQEVNTALRILLKQREEDKNELESKVLSNVKELVLPYIEKIKKLRMDKRGLAYIESLESNLKDIISPFSYKLSSQYLNLTPKELQVANLIREGKTSKEIAEMTNVSRSAIDIHRYRIRNKLGLNNKKANLRSYLSSFT
jgi:PAS domain S-box-containing protein